MTTTRPRQHTRTARLHFCRRCGAAHTDPVTRCRECGAAGVSIELLAVRQQAKNPGRLASCLSCGAIGRPMNGQYREPARSVRAINVADVHVLTQDMVHHAQRRRLLVFCDNRQDAAFQAGWMKDHARRFRLRAMMADGIKASPALGRRSGGLPRRSAGRRRVTVSGTGPGSVAGRPPGIRRRWPAPAGTAQVPAPSRCCGKWRRPRGRLSDSNHGAG